MRAKTKYMFLIRNHKITIVIISFLKGDAEMCKGHFKQIKSEGKNKGTEILRVTEDFGGENNSRLSLRIQVV